MRFGHGSGLNTQYVNLNGLPPSGFPRHSISIESISAIGWSLAFTSLISRLLLAADAWMVFQSRLAGFVSHHLPIPFDRGLINIGLHWFVRSSINSPSVSLWDRLISSDRHSLQMSRLLEPSDWIAPTPLMSYFLPPRLGCSLLGRHIPSLSDFLRVYHRGIYQYVISRLSSRFRMTPDVRTHYVIRAERVTELI